MPTEFDMQVALYIVGGARQGAIPTLTINANPLMSDLSHVSFSVSDVVYATLPEFAELAVEYWDGTAWVEGRGSRFLANTQAVDIKDAAGVRTVTAVNLWQWLFAKAYLTGVVPYAASSLKVGSDPAITGATSTGSTVTKAAHPFINGDAIVPNVIPKKMTALKKGTVYYVGSATANTFKVLGSRNGGAKVLGTFTGIGFRRIADTILSPGTQFREHDKVTFTDVSLSPNLRTDTSYYVVQKEAGRFKVSSQVGGEPIDIVDQAGAGTTALMRLSLYRELDGDRQFATTPGAILAAVIDEAKARGWGSYLSYDFTTTTDSAGVPWAQETILQFAPGTSGVQILARLTEMGLVDFDSTGRTLHLWAGEHGNDLSQGGTPVQVGVTASAVPVKSSLDDLITDLTVQGEGALRLDLNNPAAPTALGRLEKWESLSGVLDTATATLLGQNTLKQGGQTQRQYTVTQFAVEAEFLPFIHYQVGDWVSARVGDEWLSLRVVELVLSKDNSGVVTVSLVLNSRFIELLAKLARRRAAATGGISAGGTGSGGTGSSGGSSGKVTDTRKPKAPATVLLESQAGWNADGAAYATINTSWTQVVQAIDGTMIDVDVYEVWIRRDGAKDSKAVGATKNLSLSDGPYDADTTHYVKVRAKSIGGQWGPFSPEYELVTAIPLDPLDPPTALTLSCDLGVVTAKWDGMLQGADSTYVPPAQFAYTYTVMSDAEASAYTPVGQNLGHAGGATIPGLTMGGTYWFKAYAVDRLGIASQPSEPRSIVVTSEVQVALEAAQQSADDAAAAAKAAGRYVQDDAPPGTDFAVGELWYRTAGGHLVGMGIWDGTVWVPRQSIADSILVPGSAGTISIADGAITTPKILAGAVVADKIGVGALHAEHIALGTALATGETTQRVPGPPTDAAYWAKVIDGTIPLSLDGAAGRTNVEADIEGLILNAYSRLDVTAAMGMPASGKLFVRWQNFGPGPVIAKIREYDFALTEWLVTPVANGETFTLLADSSYYCVSLEVPSDSWATVQSCQVFEVIGSQTGQQGMSIAPDGMRMRSDDGLSEVDLTTSGTNFLTLTRTVDDVKKQTTIDAGTASLDTLSVDTDIDIQGSDLLGAFLDAEYNGNSYEGPILDRLARGVIYFGSWATANHRVVTTQFQRLGSGWFVLEDGREYELSIDNGALATRNNSGVNQYLELRLDTVPMEIGGNGIHLSRSVMYTSGSGNFVHAPARRKAVAGASLVEYADYLPAGVPLYWQYNTNASSGHSGFTLDQPIPQAGLLIRDIGAAIETTVATDTSNAGQPAPPAPQPKTTTFNSTWSGAWREGGSTLVVGSGTFDNAKTLYQGIGASAMGSRFGWGPLGLSGKTITACQIWVQNSHTSSSAGVTARFGTGSATSAGSSMGGRSNAFDVKFSKGQGKWVNVPRGSGNAIWNGIQSGAIRNISLGPSGSDSDYSRFNGFGQSKPPKIRITYK